MECLVCKRKFTKQEEKTGFCPLCGFPVVEILDADFQKGVENLKPQTDAHRKTFVSKGSVFIQLYLYDTEDSTILSENQKIDTLGTFAQLSGGTVWIKEKFEQVFSSEELPVLIFIEVSGKKFKINASVPNLPSADTLELGAFLDENFRLHLSVRFDGKTVRSAKETYYLFSEEIS